MIPCALVFAADIVPGLGARWKNRARKEMVAVVEGTLVVLYLVAVVCSCERGGAIQRLYVAGGSEMLNNYSGGLELAQALCPGYLRL